MKQSKNPITLESQSITIEITGGTMDMVQQDDGTTAITLNLTAPAPPPPEPEPVPPPTGPIGNVYLHPSYKDANKYPDPTTSPGLTNTHVQGILWRQTWALLEPVQNARNWGFIGDGVKAAGDAGKLQAVELLTGAFSPSWFYSLSSARPLTLTKPDRKSVV